MNISELVKRTLLLDLETTRTGKIRHVGAVFGSNIFEKDQRAGSREVLKALDALAENADFVLGHNLLGHDFPILKAVSPKLEILQKPVIDTLYLSPVAFPQNPYHRLVKNYKLVRATVSSPVEDAKLALSVFRDQWESFVSSAQKKADLIDFYGFCFEDSIFNTFSGSGIATVFSGMVDRTIRSPDDAFGCFLKHAEGKVCAYAAKSVLGGVLSDPARRPSAAYCTAWLQVAGGNSVLPPWVRYRFPEIPSMIETLREVPCGRSNCRYCRKNHNPDAHLERIFGYPSFREKPATEEGTSLQKAIVEDSMGGTPVLGIPAHGRRKVPLLSAACPGPLLAARGPDGGDFTAPGTHERSGGQPQKKDRNPLRGSRFRASDPAGTG